MKILVTRWAGLAGSAIAHELVNHGYEVLRADNVAPAEVSLTSGQAGASSFKFVETTDAAEVISAMQGCDPVIHMAAVPNPRMASEFEGFRVNMLPNRASTRRSSSAPPIPAHLRRPSVLCEMPTLPPWSRAILRA